MNYPAFFRNVIYTQFIDYISNTIGIAKFTDLTRGKFLFDSKRGVNDKIKPYFQKFLSENKELRKVYLENGKKVFTPKNICGGILMGPVNVLNDTAMVLINERVPMLERNPTIFIKTEKEKERLKIEKSRAKANSDLSDIKTSFPKNNKGRLFIQVNGNSECEKSTLNFENVMRSEISSIMKAYHVKMNTDVVKMKFNDEVFV